MAALAVLLASCASSKAGEQESIIVTDVDHNDLGATPQGKQNHVPDFEIWTTQGPFHLSEELKTHEYVFVNFWTASCNPCKKELSIIQAMYKRYGDRIAFLSVAPPHGGTEETAEEIADTYGLTYSRLLQAEVRRMNPNGKDD